ncbi:MAG: response regulator [Acidobacteriota bacterium]
MSARILIIEDNPANLELMSYLLNAFGHLVTTSEDGETGLEAARRKPPDLIVCDVQLPGMSGYDVARYLKTDPLLKQVPLVAVTALAMMGDRDKVLSAGFDGYIAKPIAPETFVGQVESFLRNDQRSAPQVAHPITQSPPSPQKRATILVVDNSPVNIEVARSILEPNGYEVIGATRGKAAFALMREMIPDLILCDLHMPYESGFDLISAVRLNEEWKRIPFIMISSTVMAEKDIAESRSLGVNKFILRPIEPETLLAEIEDCLRRTD